jgi:hypothetical protein
MDLERLGYLIVSHRVAMGYRNRTELANSLQLTARTLSDIEHGARKASPGAYAMLENKLDWAPGSIDTILAGGEPKEHVLTRRRDIPEPRYASFTTGALSRASTEELVLELCARSMRSGDRRRERVLYGQFMSGAVQSPRELLIGPSVHDGLIR